MKTPLFFPFVLLLMILFVACSSVNYTVKKGFPKYSTEKTFEASYSRVWAATYNAIAANADIEIAEESDGIIKTGWSYGTSDINVAEYKLDDQMRYKPLRLRYKYVVTLKKKFSGIKVGIKSYQDYEELSSEGPDVPSDSWVSTESSTARENKLLQAIKNELRK